MPDSTETGVPIAGFSRVYHIPQIPYPPELNVTPAEHAALIEAAVASGYLTLGCVATWSDTDHAR